MLLKRKAVRVLGIAATLTAACAMGALAGQSAMKLVINGNVASERVRTIGGEAWVPVKDMARALGMNVAAKSGGLEMIREGGANQIANDNVGKMGDEVFTGKWRFAVTGLDRAQTFKQQLKTGYQKEVSANGNGELLLVRCRIKNGTKQKDTLVFAKDWDGINTAITDSEGHSYESVLYDARFNESAPDGVSFLPGSAIDFVVVFDVPKGMQPKDLIFTAMRYEDRAKFDQPKRPPTDIRYSLSR